MPKAKEGIHQIHVEISSELWEQFRLTLPEDERGLTSAIVRRLIKAYVKACNDSLDYVDVRKIKI